VKSPRYFIEQNEFNLSIKALQHLLFIRKEIETQRQIYQRPACCFIEIAIALIGNGIDVNQLNQD
jgi:hypothetical protein